MWKPKVPAHPNGGPLTPANAPSSGCSSKATINCIAWVPPQHGRRCSWTNSYNGMKRPQGTKWIAMTWVCNGPSMASSVQASNAPSLLRPDRAKGSSAVLHLPRQQQISSRQRQTQILISVL